MKITSFNPLIVTSDAENIIKLFEEMGFERRHSIDVVSPSKKDVTNVRMKDANGFYVDVSGVAGMQQDLTLIRMNVDNFEEAYEYFISKGFTNPSGDATVDTRTNRSAMLRSPSGFAFDLCQHIKES